MEGFTTKKQQFATVWKMHTAGDAQWYPAHEAEFKEIAERYIAD